MQALNAAPREHLDPADVDGLLRAGALRLRHGADLLDLDDQVVLDLTPWVRSWKVAWSGTGDIHRTCELVTRRELAWDRDRVRPWVEVSSPLRPGLRARFWRGVFVMTRPQLSVDGSSVQEHVARGYDKLHLLRSPVGETWSTRWTETGQATAVGPEVRRVLKAAGYRGRLVLPPAAEEVLLTEPMVWPLDDGATTYLRIANEELARAGFTKLRVDVAGTTSAQLVGSVDERAPEFVLDADDPRRTLLRGARVRVQDLATIPNAWRFVNSAYDGEPLPGEGIYDAEDNTSNGPTSIEARGQRQLAVIRLDAVDQPTLIRLGEDRRARDVRAAGTRQLTTGPLPLLDHDDLLELRDIGHGDPVRAVVTTWSESSTTSAVPLTVEEVSGA